MLSGTLALAVPVDTDIVGPETTGALFCTSSSSWGSCTGHKLHTERRASQYTSTSNRGKPTPRRFEKHFWKALCSNWLSIKHDCVKEAAARVWKLIGTRRPTSRCACSSLAKWKHEEYRETYSERFAPWLYPTCVHSSLIWVVKIIVG